MKKFLFLIAFSAVSAMSLAAPYSWIVWDQAYGAGTSAHGTISTSNGTVGVTLTGQFYNIFTSYPSWTPVTSYADGTIINNAPDDHSIVQLITPGAYSLTFDRPVQDLAFAAWSVGSGGATVSYVFDHNLVLDAGGPGAEYGGSSIVVTGPNSFSGTEGNGTVLFGDTFTTLNWNTVNAENWHGFTIGLKTQQVVPEPTPMMILAGGLVVLGLLKRRS